MLYINSNGQPLVWLFGFKVEYHRNKDIRMYTLQIWKGMFSCLPFCLLVSRELIGTRTACGINEADRCTLDTLSHHTHGPALTKHLLPG